MISGKCFADRCDWIFDTRYPQKRYSQFLSKSGDWVFINGDFLERIPTLHKKFTWIVHNSDRPFGKHELNLLLPYALRIYAINTTVSHPLLKTIPIGFVDRQLPFLSAFKNPNVERDIEMYGNFTLGTNTQKRQECIDTFKETPAVVFKSNLSVEEYYSDLCRSKFVLCPEGTGLDTHRVYEALFCGAIPVVLRNSLSELYSKLPICILDSWTDPFYVPTSSPISFNPNMYL
jgi:hypothetical protein